MDCDQDQSQILNAKLPMRVPDLAVRLWPLGSTARSMSHERSLYDKGPRDLPVPHRVHKQPLWRVYAVFDSWASERRKLPFQGAGTAFGLVAAAVPLMIAAGPLNLVAAGAGLLAAAAGTAGLVPDLLRRAPASTGLEYLLQSP